MSRIMLAQWSTGGVGQIAVRVIADRPDLELVAAWVHDPAKVGRDVGEVCGVGRLGVATTSDPDTVLAAEPDCVVYTASGEARPAECVADLVRLLRAGVDVVTTSIPGLVHPTAYDPNAVAELEAAAVAGGASLYASGVEPGFAADHLVLTLATMSNTISTVRTQELFGYQDYPVAFTIFEVFGFGRPPDAQCLMELPGVQASAWAPPVHMVAAHLGVELDEIRETYDKRVTDDRLEVAAGVIDPGTVGAVRFETIGVVDGREAIVIEHVNRMAPDIAPDWPRAARDGTYRVVIDGDPSLTCELTLGARVDDASEHGMVATAMRVVNAVPALRAAAPGIVTATELPLTLPPRPFRHRGAGADR